MSRLRRLFIPAMLCTSVVCSSVVSAEAISTEQPSMNLSALIESVNITMAGADETTSNNLQYRKVGDSEWLDANGLYYDPVGEQLSGAIVRLTPATAYEVKLSVQDNDGEHSIVETVTTRANKPPIDPDKIYNLKDIYDGGVLNVEALGIEGSEDGWAMIKGDKATPIIAGDDAKQAIWLGAQSYVYFEDIVIEQGGDLGFFAEEAHHIWVNGCDISNWGREAAGYDRGRAYDHEGRRINHDSAFYLRRTGVVTIENCYVHDPVLSANHWGYGHPKGSNAFIAFANHPDEAFQGQIILRNNTFMGSDSVRFNDVVESRYNLSEVGGFIRDSAIYNNRFAYANDDIIELDGSQHNVLVYNNEFSHAYGGISVAPNRQGPSYIFNNTTRKMGDERGEMWASLKAGGLSSNPEGQVNFFNNYVISERNGITASNVEGDNSFWVNAINNVLLSNNPSENSGFGVWDPQRGYRSRFINNYSFNLEDGEVRDNADISEPFYDDSLVNQDVAVELKTQPAPKTLPVPETDRIPNFSVGGEQLVVGITDEDVGAFHYRRAPVAGAIDFNTASLQSYGSQNQKNAFTPWHNELSLEGNTWLSLEGEYQITENTVLDATVYGEGNPELAGIGFDNDERIADDELIAFYGTQSFGIPVSGYESGARQQRFSLPVGQLLKHGEYSNMVFALDDDAPSAPELPLLSLTNVRLYNALNFTQNTVSAYDVKQDSAETSNAEVSNDGLSLTLSGNAWKRVEGDFNVEADSVLVAQVRLSGTVEIAGLGFDTNNSQNEKAVLSFGGSQNYGLNAENVTATDGWQRIEIPVGELMNHGAYRYMTFIADNDAAPEAGQVEFRHVSLFTPD